MGPDGSMWAYTRGIWAHMGSLRGHWIKAALVRIDCVWQYSVARQVPREAIGAKQFWRESIVFCSILSPGRFPERPLEQSKFGANQLCFAVFCRPAGSLRGQWSKAMLVRISCVLQYSVARRLP